MPDRKEYIERGAVERMLENAQTVSDGEYSGYCTEDISLDEISIADVVEVVRCRDCKHWTRDGNGYCDDESYCNNPDGLDNYAKPDDYCSYGEKKDGADNG